MIRQFTKHDISRVAEIWLDTNIRAHSFIPAGYWSEQFETVKTMFHQAQLYVFENEDKHGIEGFVGLKGHYIAGIFVHWETQSHGIGKQLLDHVKRQNDHLRLHVYCRNTRAVRFYQRENFQIQCECIDDQTGEKEFLMTWQSPAAALT